MEISKLFGVLVVGGSLLGGCGAEQDPPDAEPDAGESVAAHTSEAAPESKQRATAEDNDELIDCGFCPNEMCCETDEEGNASVKAGFECCWSTTC